MRALRARAAASPAIEALGGIAVGAIIFVGGYQSMQGNLTAGEFMGFITALLAVYQPLRSVATVQTWLQEGVSAGNRVFTILDARDEIVDGDEMADLKVSDGAIRFDNVGFQYTNRDGGFEKCIAGRKTRTDDCPCRRIGLGQIHLTQSDLALFRHRPRAH